MKVLNVSESTVFLDDINIAVIYDRHRKPFEIVDSLARKSRTLQAALDAKVLVDVTNGVPEGKIDVLVNPDAPYFKKQGMLVKDDRSVPTAPTGAAPSNTINSYPSYSTLKSVAEGPTALEVYKETGQLSALWSGPAHDAGGYARMNRKFMFGLAEKGVNLRYELLQSMPDMDPATSAKLKKLEGIKIPRDTLKVYGMTAPGHYSWERYKLLFTMMETRRLHKDYVERCNCADEIVVPSEWCKEVFLESGVKKPLAVVPLGVDLDIYKPDVEPIGFSKNLKPFIFLSVFGWSLRKGYDVMLRAFLEEFTSDDPVSLLISSRYFGSTDESKKQVIRNDIARISSTVTNPKKPQVILFGDVLSDEMMPRLFAAADCYVLISRGEGFGLPYAEAGACKIPVIGTRYSGHTDFLNDENSWLVDVDGFRSAETTLAWISYFYEDAEFPIFGSKAVEQTRYFMRQAFEKKEVREEKANKLHQRIVADYGWPSCVNKMHEKLKDTYEKLSERK